MKQNNKGSYSRPSSTPKPKEVSFPVDKNAAKTTADTPTTPVPGKQA